MNKRLCHTGFILLAAILLVVSSGCDLLAGYMLSFSAGFGVGWLAGQSSVSVTTECYLNGEPIDCAEVPY